MSHQHAIITDSVTKASIGSNQLPRPMNWKVLIQPNDIKAETKGGILLPDKVKENEQILTAHGTVMAIGELAYRERETGERWKQEIVPQVGDKVTYGKYAGQKIVVNNVRFLLLNDDEITAILPDGVEVTAYV
jgi:co-chaperonin GroES (HSP10)